ncbi:MAG: hypothetical protein QXK37_03480 [Candidatus Woesearchaeota archaeon]
MNNEKINSKVKQDIFETLSNVIKIVKKRDSFALRELSDHTIHNASIFQDRYSITIAVLIYALSKMIDRMARIEPRVIDLLLSLKKNLKENDIDAFEKSLESLMHLISEFDTQLNLYVHHVLSEARIKKGSRIYEHGISLAQTAKLLGTTQWELMRYIGQTKIADSGSEDISASERLNFARRLFS